MNSDANAREELEQMNVDPSAGDDYAAALAEQEAAEADLQQSEIPHSSSADVLTMILAALMLIGLIICMTIYM
ncbi:hypothetical protein [Corynebacterium terpenotabidum]|uniref:Uncharacterized protein n=1 Tax=Corynebacterium terpenotabidum Y-11 TaxID=1200352 RepID=S4XH20_9CORY|nr:hypothetical protein [Corynebacterium terpenotabidum]AGP31846.1 hypothetical protein A606_11035 [Corynebacterium terpenotabidum Y-11]